MTQDFLFFYSWALLHSTLRVDQDDYRKCKPKLSIQPVEGKGYSHKLSVLDQVLCIYDHLSGVDNVGIDLN